MADPKQIERLRQGVASWNSSRGQDRYARIDLTAAHLTDADLRRADLAEVDLTRADMFRADLSAANLTGAHLTDSNLSGADLTDANLNHASLFRARLSGARLTGAHLTRANLTRADLSEADLAGANLTRANLTDALLLGAQLTSAHLTGADLSGANLTGAQLAGAHLAGAILSDTVLAGANLTGVGLMGTHFGNVDLSETVGLDTCTHGGPSSLDCRTLTRSGRLPLGFLRGCGLPDTWIDYLPSLRASASAIRHYSLFISYSTTDQEFADRLYADLQANGVRCWFAPHDMKPGKKIHDQIDEAIRIYDRLLLILSPESMRSPWVGTEIAKARQKEVAAQCSVLFPIALVPFEQVRTWQQFDADIGDDSARRIREYFIPDFSDWKNHDSYRKSFENLLKALKSS